MTTVEDVRLKVDVNAVAPSVDMHADATEVDVNAVAPSENTHANAMKMDVLAKANIAHGFVCQDNLRATERTSS